MATKRAVDDGDDDLDDLDDVLDQFTSPAQKPPATTPNPIPASATGYAHTLPPAPPPTAVAATTTFATGTDVTSPGEIPDEEDPAPDLEDDFASELAKGMESLMREIGGGAAFPNLAPGEGDTEEQKEREREFRALWESLLIQGMDGSGEHGGANAELPGGTAKEKAKESKGDGAFQQSIRQTMDKLKKSESTLQADSNSDAMEGLLAQLGVGADGVESEEELNGLFESMMSQLMSKEVLFEPLKELHEKFPTFLKENESTLPPADLSRYKSQLDCVSKIISIFEEPKYSDQDTEATMKIVNLMTDMQSFGSPPVEIMGPMPPGFGVGPDGAPQIPEGCVIV